jgi:integrase
MPVRTKRDGAPVLERGEGDTRERGILQRKGRYYLRFVDVDGVRRTKLARGASTIVEARAALNAIERRVMEGRIGVPQPPKPDPAVERRRKVTLRELGDRFVDDKEGIKSPKLKNAHDYRMEAKSVFKKRIYPTLGTRAAAAVSSLDVEALRDALSEKYAAASVNNTLNTLSKVYGWATKEKLIDCPNPVRGIERPRADDGDAIDSTKYLSRDEAAALLAYVECWSGALVVEPQARDVFPMVATALYTGLRKGELFGLRWSDLNFERGQITVAKSYDGKTKTGKTRHVPLVPRLAPILRAWRDRQHRDPSPLVFPLEGRMGQAYETRALGAMMQVAFGREPPKVWHSLRHTYASHFVMAGGNILTLQRLLGHASVEMTADVYSHLAPDFMAAEAARLDFSTALAGVTPIAASRSA